MDGVELHYPEGTLPLPVREATVGASGLEISRLLRDAGYVTLDPGYANTASCSSSITFIDGDAGVLRHRGYLIGDLASHASFLDVAHLLIHEALPTASQGEEFARSIATRQSLDKRFDTFFASFPRDAHPMAILAASVNALSAFSGEGGASVDVDEITLSLLAKIPTFAARSMRHSLDQPFIEPDPERGYVENFLRMCFGTADGKYQPDPDVVKVLDMLFVLHADHEQNCSTSTVRLVGSSQADLFASVAAGVNALSGPLHGGANEAVINMLEHIARERLSVQDFIRGIKENHSGVRLMGFGHRVYKNYDPRAMLVKEAAREMLTHAGKSDPLLSLAIELEEAAVADEYFTDRKLYPNVDFYTGLIYRAMGFPSRMFTPLFTVGRTAGWIAQWREMAADSETRIGRPRQIYVGAGERAYDGAS